MNLLNGLIFIGLLSLFFIGGRKVSLIIAGDVSKKQSGSKNGFFIPMRHYRLNGKRISPKEYPLIGKLVGNSLTPFGIPDGAIVFCTSPNGDKPKRNDVVILKIISGVNSGRLKGRVVLGFWGDPDQPDPDLVKFENFSGTVKDFFEKESKRKYNYSDDEIYKGPYRGLLKTLSFDRNRNGTGLKVSRPHSMDQLVARVAFAI